MTNNQTHIFVTASTYAGNINFISTNLDKIKHVKIIDENIHSVVSKVSSSLSCPCTLIHSSDNPGMYDGLIIPKESTAYINQALMDKTFEDKCDERKIHLLTKAKASHDKLEKIYIEHFDKRSASEFTRQFISNNIYKPGGQKKPLTSHRFLGCSTKNSYVDFAKDMITDIQSVYFIKGRAGTGKSTFMKKINEAAINNGYDTELYHCSFDPYSIDMVRIPALSFCIFDSTAPHEYFPSEKHHKVIDMYKRFITPGTDERFSEEIAELTSEYKNYIKKAVALI